MGPYCICKCREAAVNSVVVSVSTLTPVMLDFAMTVTPPCGLLGRPTWQGTDSCLEGIPLLQFLDETSCLFHKNSYDRFFPKMKCTILFHKPSYESTCL